MAPKPQALLLLLPLLLLSPVTATDILEILNPLSDYSTFTKYLIEANLVDEINRRDNVTVLAVKNSEITPISSLPADVRKNVMSVHVLLGYYDPYSISHLPDKTSLVPTLFQTTGLAANQNGYVKVTVRPIRQIIFGSATPGSPLESYLINVVGGTDSDKVSVLHISDPIIPSGIDGARKTTAPVTTPPSASSPAKQVTPASSPAKQVTPASSPAKQVTPAPAPMEKKAATGPANAPKAATGPANAPKASASSPSTGNVPEAPAAPPKEAGKAPTSPSSAGRVVVGATMGLAMGVVLLGVC